MVKKMSLQMMAKLYNVFHCIHRCKEHWIWGTVLLSLNMFLITRGHYIPQEC